MAKTTLSPGGYVNIIPEDLAAVREGREVRLNSGDVPFQPDSIEMQPVFIRAARPKPKPDPATERFLVKALKDEHIDSSERKKLLSLGYSPDRLAKLAGKDGWAPMRRKMRWYGETLRQTAHVKADAQGWMQGGTPAILENLSRDAKRAPQAAKASLPALTAALRSAKREIRFQAIEALRSLPPQTARRALSAILNRMEMEKERDVEVFASLHEGTLRIGFAPGNLHAFAHHLSQLSPNFLEQRLNFPESLAIFSASELSQAYAELSQLHAATPRVRFTIRTLGECLEAEFRNKGMPYKSPESWGSRRGVSPSERKLELALLDLREATRGM